MTDAANGPEIKRLKDELATKVLKSYVQQIDSHRLNTELQAKNEQITRNTSKPADFNST